MTTTAMSSDEMSSPVWLRFGERKKQNRVTIFFRVILLIPQYIVLYFLGLALFFAGVFAWVAALVTGKVPESLAFFITGVIRWVARVHAYGLLLNDRYPPFALESRPDYPVDLAIQSGRLNRLAVLFRLILVIPAAILQTLLELGASVFGIVLWVAALILGELPESFYGAAASVVRFQARVAAYLYMVTSFYPGGIFGDAPPALVPPAGPAGTGVPGATEDAVNAPAPAPAASPWELVLSKGARTLVGVFIALGVLGAGGAATITAVATNNAVSSIHLQNDATSAFNALAVQEEASTTKDTACGNDLSCHRSNAATLAAAVTLYGDKIAQLDVPASARAAQLAAEQAARQTAAELTAMAHASSVDAYNAALSGFNSGQQSVQTTFENLHAALANG